MRRFLMMTAIAATTLGGTQFAQADQRPGAPTPVCHQDKKKCPEAPHREPGRNDQKKHKDQKPAPQGDRRDDQARPGDDRRLPPAGVREGRDDGRHHQRPGEPERRADRGPDRRIFEPGRDQHHLRVGDSGRGGEIYKPGRHSALRKAPHGTEYRVIRDQLVLVDKKDKRIVDVIGPTSRLR
ncbi:hypothetical protein [Paracoccus sp. KR1-242]|uniref:hypothetical protein n=1 Tax=Paracoccus sp. KR1-242 TaxID=3410028 RepID=UPI003C066154